MSGDVQTFEVRVQVRQKGSRHFSSHVGMYIDDVITKMFHIDARTPAQAIRKSEKYGRPISVRKADVGKMAFNIETLLQRERYGLDNPYSDAIAMDEMIWQKKGKRVERISNETKDKNGH